MAFDAKIRLSSDTSRVDAGIASVQRKIAGLASGFGNAIAGFVSVSVITSAVKNMMDFADNIQDASDRLGVTIKRVQELQTAAKLAGKDLGLFEKTFQNIESAAHAATNGDKKVMAKFAALGLSPEQVKTSNKNDLLTALLTGAGGMDRSSAEAALSGIVGKKNAGTLLGMSESITNPDSMGVPPVDDNTINGLADMNDQLTIFIDRWRNEVMPYVLSVANFFLDLFRSIRQAIDVTVAYIYNLFSDFTNSPLFKAFEKIASGNVYQGLRELGKIGQSNLIANSKVITDTVMFKQSLGSALGEAWNTTVSNTLGKTAMEAGRTALNESVMDVATENENADKTLEALRAARKKRQQEYASNTNRTDNTPKAPGNLLLDGSVGGSNGATYGNLIGVNASYRLERLSMESNQYLSEIKDLLEKSLGTTANTWIPPEN